MPLLLQDSASEQPNSSSEGNNTGQETQEKPIFNHTQFGPINAYNVLGVDTQADPGAIKSAYRSKALELGPPGDENKEAYQKLNWAHDALSDPEIRAEHDQVLADSIRTNTEGQRASRAARPSGQDRMHQYGPFGGEIPKGVPSIFEYTHLFRGIPIEEMGNKSIEVQALQQRLDSLKPLQKKLVMNLVIIVSDIQSRFPDSGIELNVDTIEKIISYAEAWEPALMRCCGIALAK